MITVYKVKNIDQRFLVAANTPHNEALYVDPKNLKFLRQGLSYNWWPFKRCSHKLEFLMECENMPEALNVISTLILIEGA